MENTPVGTSQQDTGRRRAAVFPIVWAGVVAVVYLFHFTAGWYHGNGSQWLFCLAFAVPPFALAWLAGFLIWWVCRRPIEPIRKVCYAAIVAAIAVPLICMVGFLWLLMHMAP